MGQPPVPPIPYEPDAPAVRAGRRGYRLLVGLTLLNTLLFTGYFLGPPTYRAVRAAWDDRQKAARAKLAQQQAAQQARAAEQVLLARAAFAAEHAAAKREKAAAGLAEAQRRERQRWLDLLRPCQVHHFPHGAAAYEQDPGVAAGLARTAGYVRTSDDPDADWGHPPVRLPSADSWTGLRDALEASARSGRSNGRAGEPPELKLREAGTPVFLHERTASDGSRRVVVVLQRAWHDWYGAEQQGRITLRAFTLGTDPAPGARPDVVATPKRLEVYGGITWIDFAAPRPAAVPAPVRSECMFRLHAGQPDPADASHFTFDAFTDGRPVGSIDGRLLPGGLVSLQPSGGRVEEAAEETRWRPFDWRDRRRRRAGNR